MENYLKKMRNLRGNEDLELRRKGYLQPELRVKRSYLEHYANLLAQATKGALMPRWLALQISMQEQLSFTQVPI